MFHPTRGGTRGGRDQFKWDDVKEDKHRENYLGNSLMAPVGRWQKGKDLTWYAKETTDDTKSKAKLSEIAKIKEAEAEAMAIALGVKKKKTLESKVTADELKHAISKDDDDDDHDKFDTEKGLGYGKSSRFPIQQQYEESSSMELMNARAYSDAPKKQTNEDEYRDKKKSKKQHKSKRHRRHDGDDEEEKRHKRHHRKRGDSSERHRSDSRRDKKSSRHDRDRSTSRHRSSRRSRSRSPYRSRK